MSNHNDGTGPARPVGTASQSGSPERSREGSCSHAPPAGQSWSSGTALTPEDLIEAAADIQSGYVPPGYRVTFEAQRLHLGAKRTKPGKLTPTAAIRRAVHKILARHVGETLSQTQIGNIRRSMLRRLRGGGDE